ncbi:UvrD-helicase domain-containing protein [Epidermidibacterium keratini]|uniref:DNA 3'-5' helicase n=1 Tax=Epidermidibacterium keratini TaxID=1891644 RepID=A0A7L4YS58_9ACTN|nr:UvrD-helicase domain-containing protein [Epidermidibacterium keratini]QHC01629.1 UvrD-helicase domain-containing protein [Epidermidibacterium keratini]
MSEQAEPADQAARSRIRQSLDETLFVEAGAGSGKTGALVQRIGELVTVGDIPIEKIAAVTFTERAAAELRERLRARFENAARDPQYAEIAQRALDDLDLAPIGTLHAFAQRILSEHAIEAGIPPMVEVLDGVASSVASEARWRLLARALLDDDSMAETVGLLAPLDIKLPKIRSLVTKLNDDWDLVQDHIGRAAPGPVEIPDLSPIIARGRELVAHGEHCTSEDDTMFVRLDETRVWLDEFESVDASDLPAILTVLTQGRSILGNGVTDKSAPGNKAKWKGFDLPQLKVDYRAWIVSLDAVKNRIAEAVLRNIVQCCASRVLDDAQDRQRNGRLEFHDLLVLCRNLLRDNADVREALHERYSHLLLDEFQDTDPIQIEIATRIAGGAAADAPDWRDIDVPAGTLFVVGDPKQSIYRFRRADIGMYLQAQEALGGHAELSTNFRTGAPILQWVNEVFADLIQPKEGQQPHYRPLLAHRPGPTAGPPVAVLGVEAHHDEPNANELRAREAADVAATIAAALDPDEPWTTQDGNEWRALRPGDITILIPSRTSLSALEDALDRAGIHYRSEASSLAYAGTEVRALLAACRAIADSSNQLALLSALRSPLFGISDLELWEWKRSGGSVSLRGTPPEAMADHPVGVAIDYLARLGNESRWLTPSEVLSRLVVDRMVFEAAAGSARPRDVWRTVRFVIDQARAWSETEHGGLRSYVEWAAAQASETSRVSESILPETDVDSVRIMTVHAAKGLEFPMVILSGMSTQRRNTTGVNVLWNERGYAVSMGGDLTSGDFETMQPVDEQMGDAESRRLLYVAATRARDHLVVSLHRARDTKTNARLLAEVGAASAADAVPLSWDSPSAVGSPVADAPTEAPDFESWLDRIRAAVESSRRKPSESASGLEGTDPDAVPEGAPPEAAGHAKGARDVAQSAWTKGRYGSAIGRAVHGVLQAIPLDSADGLDPAVQAQCVAEGVVEYAGLVALLVRSALDSPVVRRAADRPHWRESWVAMVCEGGTVLEGIVDLIYREDDGSLVVVDYKTDTIPEGALAARTAYYAPQVRAYRDVLQVATNAEVGNPVLVFAQETGAPLESTVPG